ncbi:MAG: DUF1836 domain-containing protein [Anaerofustis stercorihominis]|nr:DUF1836 domain-containing protein [Anaerofustis stercorihominis]
MPRYNELPNMGLYLEQTTKYINTFLQPLGCIEITPSMVSNYVKKDVIPNPIKKLYYADHIVYIIFVSFAKNLLTIENIGHLIEMQRASYTLPVAYDYFCNELENMLFYNFGLKDSVEFLGETQSMEKDMLKSLVFSAASIVHMHACIEAIKNRDNK